jgi:hypothetical protein
MENNVVDNNKRMVYITKSTLNQIMNKVDEEEIKNQLNNIDIVKIGNNSFDYLNKFQVKQILLYKYLSENIGEIHTFKKVEKKVDENRYLIKTTTPKYHLFSDCEYLKSNFENMLIPRAIFDKGEETIEKYRDYMKTEFGDFEPKKYKDQLDLIVSRINNKFQVEVFKGELAILEADNKGSTQINNLSLVELEEKAIKFMNEYENLCKTYPDIFPQYTMKSFLSVSNPEELKFIPARYFKEGKKDEFLNILRNFYTNIQTATFDILKLYFTVYYNPDLKFDGDLLEELGLKPCNSCQTKLAII